MQWRRMVPTWKDQIHQPDLIGFLLFSQESFKSHVDKHPLVGLPLSILSINISGRDQNLGPPPESLSSALGILSTNSGPAAISNRENPRQCFLHRTIYLRPTHQPLGSICLTKAPLSRLLKDRQPGTVSRFFRLAMRLATR